MNTLTPSQKAAIDYTQNILVEAGAGSGKTTLFVQRYCELLIKNPELTTDSILALSFTQKAASECMERIYTYCQTHHARLPNLKKVIGTIHSAPITTFHGFCSMILKEFSLEQEQALFTTVLGDDESQYLFKLASQKSIEILAQLQSPDLKLYLSKLSENQLKNHLVACHNQQDNIAQILTQKNNSLTPLSWALLNIYNHTKKEYEAFKEKQNSLDYSDLIHNMRKLLDQKNIQKTLQKRYRFIMIDECQDTDPLQWDILKKCCSITDPLADKKLFLVGDTKQCIYRFRGAELDFFSTLHEQFKQNKNSKNIALTDNFRSSPVLLEKLNPTFKHMFEKSTEKQTVYTELKANKRIQGRLEFSFLKDSKNQEDEHNYIYTWLCKYIEESPSKTIAILARERRQCESLFTYLKSKGLHVQTDKQKGFFSQQLIIDCYQVLRLLVYPEDMRCWSSILQSPFLGLSASLCQHILTSPKETILERISATQELQTLKKNEESALKIAEEKIKNWFNDNDTQPLLSTLCNILRDPHAQHYIQSTNNGNYQIDIFISILNSLINNPHYSRHDIIDLLKFKLSIHNSAFDIPQSGQHSIQIMTIHAAKGLEFDCVVLAACNRSFPIHTSSPCIINNNFFHVSSGSETDKAIRNAYFLEEKKAILDEEKRLFYVACTRAKETLLLSGLYHSPNTQLNSYLSFIQNQPHYSETPTHITYAPEENTPISIQTNFQIPKNKTQKTHKKTNIKTNSLEIKNLVTPQIKTQAITDLKEEKNKQRSLATLRSQTQGSVIHDCIMSFLSNPKLQEKKLIQCIIQHPLYTHLKTKEQADLKNMQKKIINSSTLKELSKTAFIFEYPIVYTKHNTQFTGRLDGFYMDENKITLLELKTDQCKNIEELYKKYEAQLSKYADCLKEKHPKHDIKAILYSSFLDQQKINKL